MALADMTRAELQTTLAREAHELTDLLLSVVSKKRFIKRLEKVLKKKEEICQDVIKIEVESSGASASGGDFDIRMSSAGESEDDVGSFSAPASQQTHDKASSAKRRDSDESVSFPSASLPPTPDDDHNYFPPVNAYGKPPRKHKQWCSRCWYSFYYKSVSGHVHDRRAKFFRKQFAQYHREPMNA